MSNVGSSSKGRGNGTASIPPASKKMIDSLKEIVNCPDHEIYAMLKECDMDPNDTVNRLLSQDPFHEVKSKREKRKENKDSTDSRPRGLSSSSNRGGKGTGRSSLNQFSSTDSGGIRGRPAHKKENGGTILPSYASTTSGGVSGNNVNHKPMSFSDSAPTDTTGSMLNLNDGPSLPSQLPSGYQPAWTAVPGQVSMADIVRRGRPQSKPPSISFSEPLPQSGNFPPVSTPLPTESHHDHNSSEVPASAAHDLIHEPGIAAKGSIMPEPSVASANCEDTASSSNLHNEANLYLNSQLDEVQESEDNATVENLAATSERQMQMDDSFHSQRRGLERQEDYSVTSSVEDASAAVSSAAANLQQLSLGKEDMDQPTTAEDFPAVIIPNHLQVPTADCSHLSFGSFGCSMNATFSGSFEPKTPKSNLEESNLTADSSSVEQPDAQNNEYYEDDELRSTSNENVGAPPSSQPEVIKHGPPTESTHGHQYTFPSVPGYGFENTAQANAAAYSYTQTNSQMQNLTPFPSAMQPYTNALPSNILASQVQPGRESDLPYMSFLATPSMPTKYSSAMSSISAPTMSMPEGVKPGAFSIAQSNSQTLPSTNVPGGPALPQHLPLHPYSQPTLPLGHFANMIGYPFLPHSYTYLPYAAAGNSAFHQSPAAIHSAAGIKYSVPQYKNSVSVSSLPQSATIPSGYGGGYGSSGSIPGNFNLNPSTPASTTIGYEDVISSQYKENSNYVSLQQQNEGSAMWVHGPGSRSMSPLPASTYYSIQGQNQPSGFRQGQQQSPYGTLGYPNFYHSQAGVTQEHHQQTPGEGTLSTSQGAPSQQSHQIWQHSY